MPYPGAPEPDGLLAAGDTNELAHRIRQALGVGDYDTVEITLPQFERTDGKRVYYFPSTVAEFDSIKRAPNSILRDMGLQPWNAIGDLDDLPGILWLYPAEWYDYIPHQYPIVTISGSSQLFEKCVSDNDTRFGALPYGFIEERNRI